MKATHTTWCDSSVKCGVLLADILNEYNDAKLIRKVNTHIHRFNARLKLIAHLEKDDRQYFMSLLHTDAAANINLTTYPDIVKTFLLNLIKTKYKQQLNLILNNI